MRNKKLLLLAILLLVVVTSLAFCLYGASKQTSKSVYTTAFKMPYNLKKPDKKWKLPDDLKEISGLDIMDKKHIACVQDEKGVIYVYDLKNDEIDDKIKFSKSGDYEDIELIGDTAYVVKNNGTIYEIPYWENGDSLQTNEYKTQLTQSNDVEGLCYDAKNNRLLLACKGSPGSSVAYENHKAVYAFDLATKTLQDKPLYLVNVDSIHYYLRSGPLVKQYEKLTQLINPAENISFQPSAIDIHPITGNVYLISSVGKLFAVLNEQGYLLYLEKMDKKILPQPEGITFTDSGDMLMSSEGKGKKGQVLRYKMKKEQ